jgi:hypothetical protein
VVRTLADRRGIRLLSVNTRVHWELHHRVTKKLDRWPCQEGAGENPQEPLGCAGASPRSWSHPGGSDQAISHPRCRATLEAAASPLRDDGRPPPWDGTVTAPSLLLSLEVQRRVVQAIGSSTYSWPSSRLPPMLPNAGTEKVMSCLFSRCILFAFVVMSIFLELFFPG